MGADYNDMIAKLQIAQAQNQNPQPAFMGLQAPPDPNALATVLAKLKQQQYIDGVGQTGGQYGYLHDAGQKALASVGQQLGNGLGGALAQIGQAPAAPAQPAFSMPAASPTQNGTPDNSAASVPVPAPNPGATPQQSVTNMVLAGKAYYSAQIQNGVPADQAKVNTAQALVKWGAPGADEILDKANDQLLKNASTQSQTAKDNAQAAASNDEVANRAFDQKSKTYTTTTTDPNGFFEIQTSGTGEDRRVELKPQPNAAQQALANLSPQGLDFMVQTYKQTNVVPQGLARSPVIAGKFWSAVAADPDVSSNPNSPSAIMANKMMNVSNGQALSQTVKQLSATQSYADTMSKNIDKARELGNKLDLSDPVLLNKAYGAWAAGTSDPTFAKYNVFFDAVTNEYAKIKSGSLGNSPVSDSARKEAQGVLQPLIGAAGMNAAFDAVEQEKQNRIESLTTQRDDLVSRLQGKHPVAPTAAAPAAPGAPAATAAPSPGAVLRFDAQGNRIP